jgi:hypothetical protein
VTPGYDKTDSTHLAVVATTKKLLQEYAKAIQKPEVAVYLDPNRGLPQRRTKLREVIRSLPSFAQYDTACQALYTAVAASTTTP